MRSTDVLKKVFSIIFWASLLVYLMPWILGFRGLIYGSGEAIFDRFQVCGWDAFAHAFMWGGIFLVFLGPPTFFYQVIYLICNRKNKIKMKIVASVFLLLITLIVLFISRTHFLSIDLEPFRTR